MKYLGSKNKIAKHLLPIMLEVRGNRTWVEPFVGGANMIDKVTGNRIGNDVHPYLIALLKAVQNGWIPPTEVSREMYYEVKKNPESFPNELVGFVGFLCSFGGLWWHGYARADAKNPNYANAGSSALSKQLPNLMGVDFQCGDYFDMIIPNNSLIYCDPPYEGMATYKNQIDHNAFWDWCREKVKEGHVVFVSEYNAPEDFVCIKEIEAVSTICKSNNVKKGIEKLFRHKDDKNYFFIPSYSRQQ